MKHLMTATLLAGIIALDSCKKAAPETVIANIAKGDCFQTAFGSDGVNLCFISEHDNRCPIDAICVREGSATVQFTLIVGSEQHAFAL